MICPACKAENIEGAEECTNCGAALTGLDSAHAAGRRPLPDFVRQPVSLLRAKAPGFVSVADPVSLAIRHMQQELSSCVLVFDQDELAGILTSSDILHKVAGPNEDLSAVTCGQVMTPNPICLDEDDSVALALNIMASGDFRHMPIQANGKAIGLIEVTDAFNHISPNLA